MKRSAALIVLICLMTACVVLLAAFIARTPGVNPVSAYFGAADEAYDFRNINAQTDATAAPTSEATQPDATAAPTSESAQPDATAAPTSEATQPDATAELTSEPAQPDATSAPAQNLTALPMAAGVASVVEVESFGTPNELSEDAPKYNYSLLAAQTGLDVEVLASMYTPFWVLDIDMDEVYYPLKSPGGKAGSNKIYGGQVGVKVVSIEGDYAFINAYRYPGGRAIEGYVPTSMLRQVTPDDRYSIIIDKRQQRLFLFEYGELKADMYCSTGKTTTETPAGEFLKYGTKRTIYSDADPDIAYYGIHLNGRVYIHSVSHISGDYSKSIAMLGRKASHGCVRVPLDWAEWFYDKIPDGTKVIITEYRGDTPPLGEGGRDGD